MRTQRTQPCLRLVLALLVTPLATVHADALAAWSFDDQPRGPAAAFWTMHGCETARGVLGSGLRFADGAYAELERSESLAFDSTESFTVEFWLRTRQGGFATVLMTKDRPGGNVSYSFVLGREPGRMSFELWSWGSAKLISRTRLDDNRWRRVTGVYNAATNEAALLIDGRLEALRKTGEGGPRAVQLRIGNNLDAEQPFDGVLDQLSIHSDVSQEALAAMEARANLRVLADGEAREIHHRYFERIAQPRPWTPSDAQSWLRRQNELRQAVLDDLGLWPLPERCPLDVRRGGKLVRDGYTVERVYWQTWPGYYASGRLYMPTEATFPAPAVLHPHGHWENGNRHPVVQTRLIALARMGYVCLAPDSVHAYHWAAGVVPQTVMTWNNIRGLDLLESMPEVDPERIACTGCSGGAQQTFYLMAVEDRIKAAIPVCMVSKFRTILDPEGVHCDCNHVPGIAADTDTPEMAAAQSPNPALIITVSGDWTATYVAEDHPSVLAAYDLLGAPDKVRSTRYESGHDYNQAMREEAYGFIDHWVGGAASADPIPETPVETESLETLRGLDNPPADHEGLPAIVREFRLRRLAGGGGSPAALRASLRRALRLDAIAPTAPAAESRGAFAHDGLTVERLTISTEPDVRIPALLVRSGPAGRGAGCAVVAHERGMAEALAEPEVRERLAKGMTLLLVDPRFYGEWTAGVPANVSDMNGVILGQYPAAVGVTDLLQAAEHLRGSGQEPGLIGFGDAAALALMAGFLDERVTFVDAHAVGATYDGGRVRPFAPHVLTAGDLPDFAAGTAPRPLTVTGVADPGSWERARAAYAAVGAASALRLRR